MAKIRRCPAVGIMCMWEACPASCGSWPSGSVGSILSMKCIKALKSQLYEIQGLSNEVTLTHSREHQRTSLLLGGLKDGLGSVLLTLQHCSGERCCVCLHLHSLCMDFFLL